MGPISRSLSLIWDECSPWVKLSVKLVVMELVGDAVAHLMHHKIKEPSKEREFFNKLQENEIIVDALMQISVERRYDNGDL